MLQTPATAIPVALPWITGEPASLYWHVRAVSGKKVSPWSATKAFNMRWADVPQQLEVTQPGYIRWTPVDGATSYQVWWVRAGKVIATITNVADEREFYAFHDDAAWTGDVAWRVRAVRAMYGQAKNALPAVSYGPWSPVYHSTNAANPLTTGTAVTPVATVSDVVSDATKPRVHSLMPAFLFSGNGDTNYGLHRVYVFSDRDCVNVVFRGSIVAGPAYAPRTTGPLVLPQSEDDIGEAAGMFLADGPDEPTRLRRRHRRREDLRGPEVLPAEPVGVRGRHRLGLDVELGREAVGEGRPLGSQLAERPLLLDGRPREGRRRQQGVEYRETELPQDACQGQKATATQPAVAPRMLVFGKHGADPKPTRGKAVPYATGLSPSGKLVSASRGKISFYGSPLVAWSAAPTASTYVIEWSKTKYPWRPAGHVKTPATSAVLPLQPGTWFYRVRGVNDSIPGNQNMQWSGVAKVNIAKPTFAVVQG